jgi:hypothetical protein
MQKIIPKQNEVIIPIDDPKRLLSGSPINADLDCDVLVESWHHHSVNSFNVDPAIFFIALVVAQIEFFALLATD